MLPASKSLALGTHLGFHACALVSYGSLVEPREAVLDDFPVLLAATRSTTCKGAVVGKSPHALLSKQ